jgi:hypothetical protein
LAAKETYRKFGRPRQCGSKDIKKGWQTERQTEILTGRETYCTERMAEIVHGVYRQKEAQYTWLTMNTVTIAKKYFKYSEYNQNPSPFYRLSPRWVSLLF